MSIAQPRTNAVIAKMKKFLNLNIQKTLESKSLLFLKIIMNHMLEINTIKGKILISSPGIKILDKH